MLQGGEKIRSSIIDSANIECRGISKSFKGKEVIKEASIELTSGLNVIVGENGAGKSTLFYIITGVLRPERGTVSLNGSDPWKHHKKAMRDVSFMPEKPSWLNGSSVREQIYWFASLSGTTSEKVMDYMDMFSISYLLNSTVQSLSSGEQQLLMLSCILGANSSIYILDEPNSNIDIHKRSLVSDAIRKKSLEDGSLFFISTHLFDEILTIYDSILVMRSGIIKKYQRQHVEKYYSIIRTDGDNIIIGKIREVDDKAFIRSGGIMTSLSLEKCNEIARNSGVQITSYLRIPSILGWLYE